MIGFPQIYVNHSQHFQILIVSIARYIIIIIVIIIITLFKTIITLLSVNGLSRAQEATNQTESQKIKSNVGFGQRGKLEYPGKNLSEQSREPTISAHI